MSDQWYYQIMGETLGPFSPAELKAKAAKGELTPDALVRRGEGEWVLAGNVKGLFDVGFQEAGPVKMDINQTSTERRGASARRESAAKSPPQKPLPPVPASQSAEQNEDRYQYEALNGIVVFLSLIAVVSGVIGTILVLNAFVDDDRERSILLASFGGGLIGAGVACYVTAGVIKLLINVSLDLQKSREVLEKIVKVLAKEQGEKE